MKPLGEKCSAAFEVECAQLTLKSTRNFCLCFAVDALALDVYIRRAA